MIQPPFIAKSITGMVSVPCGMAVWTAPPMASGVVIFRNIFFCFVSIYLILQRYEKKWNNQSWYFEGKKRERKNLALLIFFRIFAENTRCHSLKEIINSFLTTKSLETVCYIIIYKTIKNSKNEFLTSVEFRCLGYFCNCVVTPILGWRCLIFSVEKTLKNIHSNFIKGLVLKGKCLIVIILSNIVLMLSHALLLMSFFCLIFAIKIKNHHKKTLTWNRKKQHRHQRLKNL